MFLIQYLCSNLFFCLQNYFFETYNISVSFYLLLAGIGGRLPSTFFGWPFRYTAFKVNLFLI